MIGKAGKNKVFNQTPAQVCHALGVSEKTICYACFSEGKRLLASVAPETEDTSPVYAAFLCAHI